MQTLYLDTALWCDLAEGNADTTQFERAIRAKAIAPVLSFIHLLDAAKQSERSWRCLASFIDRVRDLGETLWARLPGEIESSETQAAYLRFVGVRPQAWSPLADTLIDTLPGVAEPDRLEEMRRDRTEYQTGLLLTSAAVRDEYLPFRDSEFPEVRKGLLRPFADRVLAMVPVQPKAENDNVPVTEELRRRFAERVQPQDLPATGLVWAFDQGWLGQTDGRSESDLEDRHHLPGMAYCDVGFADKRTVAALERGKAWHIPQRNGAFTGWLADL